LHDKNNDGYVKYFSFSVQIYLFNS